MRVPHPEPVVGPLVVVADDEPQIRRLLKTVLEREGYRVRACPDGRAALEIIEKEDVALLVTDLKMPRLGGMELLEAARALRPDLGTVVITGFASTETAVEALRHGADDFVTKPFSIDDLRRVVDRVLSERQLLTQERNALDHARREAQDLRRRSDAAESALETARRDLSASQRDLERRVRDLEFLNDLTRLLARGEDLQRILETTARILTARFRARLVRIEVAFGGDVHTAQHGDAEDACRVLAAYGAALLAKARRAGQGVLREKVSALDGHLEALAAPLMLPSGPIGGITLLRPLQRAGEPSDAQLLALVPQALGVAVEAEIQRRAAARSALEVAQGILDTLERRGVLPQGHAQRTSRLARDIARGLGLSLRLQEVIEVAGRLHDVGEVGVPDSVLQREGTLTALEQRMLRQHPALGATILAPLGETALYVRHHKERPDGQGYPDGLAGEEIPLGAAIIGVAEAYDAMTHHRAWRPSLHARDALAEIERLKGRQFAAAAADGLVEVLRGRAAR